MTRFRDFQKQVKKYQDDGLITYKVNRRSWIELNNAIDAVKASVKHAVNTQSKNKKQTLKRLKLPAYIKKEFKPTIEKALKRADEKRADNKQLKKRVKDGRRIRRKNAPIRNYAMGFRIVHAGNAGEAPRSYVIRINVNLPSNSRIITIGHELSEADREEVSKKHGNDHNWIMNLESAFISMTTIAAAVNRQRGPRRVPRPDVADQFLMDGTDAEEVSFVDPHAQTGVVNYVQFRAGSCLIVQIMNQIKASVDMYRKRDAHVFESLESLYRFIMNDTHEDLPVFLSVCLTQCEPLFKVFDICVEVLEFNKVVYRYNIGCIPQGGRRKLRLIKKDNHVLGVRDIDAFDRATKPRDTVVCPTDPAFVCEVSDKWHFMKKQDPYEAFVNSARGVVKVLQNQKLKDKKYLCPNVHDVVHDLLELNVEARIGRYDGAIKSATVMIDGKCAHLSLYEPSTEQLPIMPDCAKYEKLDMNNDGSFQCAIVDDQIAATIKEQNHICEAMTAFQSKVIKQSNMSNYSEGAMFDIENFFCAPVLGIEREIFDNERDNTFTEIDFTRYYTKIFMMFSFVPVFTKFDEFRPYNGEKIDPYARYHIDIDYIDPVLCEKGNDIVFGFRLNAIIAFMAKYARKAPVIKAWMQPSILNPCDFKRIIENVYDDEELADEHKKSIVNCLYGNCIKRIARKNKAIVSNEEQPDSLNVKFGDKRYIAIKKARKQFRQGFYYIGAMVLEMARIKMSNMRWALKDAAIRIIGIRTDALYIRKEDEEEARSLLAETLDFAANITGDKFDKIGSIRFADKRFANLPTMEYRTNGFEPFPVPGDYQLLSPPISHVEPLPNTHLETETHAGYDPEELARLVKDKNYYLSALGAGSGKTHAITAHVANPLLVSPFNQQKCELSNKNTIKTCTIANLFNMHVCDNDGMDAGAPSLGTNSSLLEGIEHIHFDEMSLCTSAQMERIMEFVLDNPHIRFSGNGDSFQNKPVGENPNPRMDWDAYTELRIAKIFDINIYLRKCKRIKDPEQAKIMEDISGYIKCNKDSINIADVQKKFNIKIKSLSEFTADELRRSSHIAFTNARCGEINERVHTLKTDREKYDLLPGDRWLGVSMKGATKYDGVRINANETYDVVEVNRNELGEITTIKLENSQEQQFTISLATFKKRMKMNHCGTCHSYQGLSVKNDELIVHNYGHQHADLRWYYTAITRARGRINQITFCN